MILKPDFTLTRLDTEECNDGYGTKYRIDITLTSNLRNTKAVRSFIRELHDYLAGDDA